MIATKNEMLQIEKSCGLSERQLIEKAGFRCAKAIAVKLKPGQKSAVLCGNGNNGQDGLVIARWLDHWGYPVEVFLTDPENTNLDYLDPLQAQDAEVLSKRLKQFDLLIDCVFGFSFHLPLSQELSALFKAIAQSGIKTISIDLNSGLEADSGKYDSAAIKSTWTLALGAYKPAHLLNKEHQLFQHLELIPLDYPDFQGQYEEMTESRAWQLLPKKRIDSYKGENGRCLIAAGSKGCAGAAALCLSGAEASGCAYLHAFVEEEIYPLIAARHICPVYHFKPEDILKTLEQADSVVIGPGCVKNEALKKILPQLLSQCQIPLVLDAAALRWLSADNKLFENSNGPLILTPHLGEFAALCQKTIAEISQDKISAALQFVQKWHCILVLKGPNTLIADPSGRIYINQTGNPKLAKAGSGDVLAGLIGGFAAQHIDPFEACMLAVWLHGAAADASPLSPWSFLADNLKEAIHQRIDQLAQKYA